LFKNLKQGLDAVRNPPDQAAIEASLEMLAVAGWLRRCRRARLA